MAARETSLLPLLWSLVLHAGLLLGLALMALPCTRFEAFFAAAGLPAWLNPVSCQQTVAPPGPVIEAMLVGPAAAPAKAAAPPPPPPAAKPQPEKPPVKTLPPPPPRPAARDQEKAVAVAEAAQRRAEREQEELQRQRQAELEADALLARLDELKAQDAATRRRAERERQRLEQLKDLDQAQPAADAAPAVAAEARSGAGGEDAGLLAQYAAALTRTITDNWLRPDNIPVGVNCPLRITQIPGGQVISARVLPACPYDEAGRRSVENAVLRAQPLPYAPYKSVFQREITLNFKVME